KASTTHPSSRTLLYPRCPRHVPATQADSHPCRRPTWRLAQPPLRARHRLPPCPRQKSRIALAPRSLRRQPRRALAPTRSGPPRQTLELLAALPLQLCRLGSAPPPPLQTRPRPSPPLGPPKPSGPRRPAQKSSGGGAPLATPAHR